MTAAPVAAPPVLSVRNLVKHFPVRSRGLLRRQVGEIHAVCGVSFDLAERETLGLVGESGCGKSTTARVLLNLQPATAGNVDITSVAVANGADMDSVAAGETFRLRVRRDTANDTATGDAHLVMIEIIET